MNGYRSMLSLVVCVMLTTAVQVYAQQYTVTDLGALQPVAVIDGPIVYGNLAGEPVVWQNGQVRVLQHYGHGGQVNGANARGDSVGYVWYPRPAGLSRAAAFWYPDGTVVLLPGGEDTEAMGVNMARVAVGIDRAQNLGLRWRPGAAEETLRSPFGATSAFAVDGVGRAWGSTGNLAAVWDVDGTFYEFIDQHGVQAGARAANDTIAAGFAPEGSSLNAAHFRLPQSITRLPRVEGTGWRCFAQAINNQHVTVGSCSRIANASVSFATVWPNTTTIQSLNDVSNASFPFGNATGISDGGYIVGTSADRGWLLAPIAEPPALALHMNRGDFRPGESWQVSIDREGGPADLHVAIILPDGITTLVLTNIETLSYIVSTIARGPYPVTAGQALAYQWHGLEPHGVYHLVAALARPGSLADGRIDAGDLLALDWKAFSFSPGELIAGR